jgi:tetraacyldisaccharide 4'-kinase
VLAVAGIAHPERFGRDLMAAGYEVAEHHWFADHHRFTPADVAALAARAVAGGGRAVVTTDKDAVRLEHLWPHDVPLYRVPVTLEWDTPNVLFDRVHALLAGMAERGQPCAS